MEEQEIPIAFAAVTRHLTPAPAPGARGAIRIAVTSASTNK
jgi:hypothetical protein